MKLKKPVGIRAASIYKVAMIMLLDVLATMASFFLGMWFRYDFAFQDIRLDHINGYLSAIGPWCVITILVFMLFRLYSSIWAFVSTSEVFRIIGAYITLAVLGVWVFHFDGNMMPRSSMVMGYMINFVCTVGIRFAYRLWRTALRKVSHMAHASGVKNVMLIGAGDAGRAQ